MRRVASAAARLGLGLGLGLGLPTGPAHALPSGPAGFCAVYPDAPACAFAAPACTLCHLGAPPTRNAYGASIAARLASGAPRPLSAERFDADLPAALRAVEGEDADGDGVATADEIAAGTLPGDAMSRPANLACDPNAVNPTYDVCAYDPRYAAVKLSLDFCGRSPTWDELSAVIEGPSPRDALHAMLDRCLDTEFWRGKDGQLWALAHPKIRPLQAIKSGDGAGPVPLADYDHDYALFVYVLSDDRDARDLLVADYFVEREVVDGRTVYRRVPELGSFASRQAVATERRAGLLTTRWNLVFNTMFTAMPRLTAAQAFRSYLGLDIARLEGLDPVPGEPRDYDAKGVAARECAICHSTLDPLSYPFRNYQGLTGRVGSYEPGRIERYFSDVAPSVTAMPETGVIFGRTVGDLGAWAEVAASSDAFAAATVLDFWELAFGAPPTAEESATFETLWRRFADDHRYRVEAMLHDLIDTEAYGVP